MEYRKLGATNLRVSAVALGCWPISGMTSLNVNEADSLATIAACFETGINFLDTAYAYGRTGESERLIARAVGGRRDELVIASKVGIAWDGGGGQQRDASPRTIRRQCETSLKRLNTDRVDLLYLHAPDPATPIEESAGALKQLVDEGKTRAVGASNCTVEQLAAFSRVCPLAACQPHYNMLQREIERDVVPWCRANDVAVVVYWPLLKGLLAGKLARTHVFAPGDGRAKYPMFQGQEWQRNQDFLDTLRPIAEEAGVTLAQLVIQWTIHQPGITAALCGAKRAAQVRENAGGAGWQLSENQRQRIDDALARRGTPISRAAV
jgi:aryl-alcohol dehydrogenase-like predicted oxidoreductase